MNHDENSNDAFDSKLSRLFAEKNEPLSANEFMTQVLPRLERAHQARQAHRILRANIVLLAAAFLAPAVARMTMRLFSIVETVDVTPTMIVVAAIGMLVITLGVLVWSRRQI